MRIYPFPLAAALVLAIAIPSHGAEKPHPAQANQSQPKKVWTNEDLDQLHSQGLISIVGPEAPAAAPAPTPSTAEANPPEQIFPTYNSRLDDADWYAKQAAALQALLDDRQAALQAQLTAMANAANRITQPGLALDQPTVGVTPQAAAAVLQAQVDDIQTQIDALEDLARQNGIPPGDLRS